MQSNVEKWIEKDGVFFLRRIGIKQKQHVLDFGCNVGHYTIPLSKVVGKEGKVFAFDKDIYELHRLAEIIRKKHLKNIELIRGKTKIPLKENSMHAVLCFDVIHYEKNRKKIYAEVYRVLKKGGALFLYPKHNRDDYPLMELATLSVDDIKKELKESGFTFSNTFIEECLHDEGYNECQVLKLIQGR